MKKETELNEIRITVPEGMEIDKENSTFECIKFKKKEEPWRYNETERISGYWIDGDSYINSSQDIRNTTDSHNVFATEKQAKSSLAMSQISQIMANDKRFGGIVTDEEWKNICTKYVICRNDNDIVFDFCYNKYNYLAFHTKEQRDLFLKENKDLVKQYLMLD